MNSPVAIAPEHNGNQRLVYDAIKRGYADIADIVRKTSLDETQVRNAIKRLKDEGAIRRKDLSGYYAVGKRCELTEAWK